MPADNLIIKKVIELLMAIKWPADPTFEIERSVQLLQLLKNLSPEAELFRQRAIALLEDAAKGGQSSFGQSSLQEAEYLLERLGDKA